MANACSPPRASDPKVGADHITLCGGLFYELASNSRSSVLLRQGHTYLDGDGVAFESLR